MKMSAFINKVKKLASTTRSLSAFSDQNLDGNWDGVVCAHYANGTSEVKINNNKLSKVARRKLERKLKSLGVEITEY